MNFKDAIACLKNQRLTIEDGFIAPEDAASRDQHPFRNRIGHLERSDGTHIGWGYSWWRQTLPDYTNRAWIQKTQFWRRGDEIHDIAELTVEEFQELEAEGDIDYVAFGQPGPDNARFDEDSRDFVFKGEKRYNEDSGEASKDSASKDEQKYVYSGSSTDEWRGQPEDTVNTGEDTDREGATAWIVRLRLTMESMRCRNFARWIWRVKDDHGLLCREECMTLPTKVRDIDETCIIERSTP